MEHLPAYANPDKEKNPDYDRSLYPEEFISQLSLLPEIIQKQFDDLPAVIKSRFFQYLAELRAERIKRLSREHHGMTMRRGTTEELHYYLVEEPTQERKSDRIRRGIYAEEDLQSQDRVEFECAAQNNFFHVMRPSDFSWDNERYLENLVSSDDGSRQVTNFMEMCWNNRKIPDGQIVFDGTDEYRQLQQELTDMYLLHDKECQQAQFEIDALKAKRQPRSQSKRQELNSQVTNIQWELQRAEWKLKDEKRVLDKKIAGYERRLQLQESMTFILRRMEADEFAVLILNTTEWMLSLRYGKDCLPRSFSYAIEEWATKHRDEKPLITPPPAISSPEKMRKLFGHFQRLAESYLRQKEHYKAPDEQLSRYEPEISVVLFNLSKI